MCKGSMVVLRLIGDEWTWEDRIALALAPQKAFTMCIPLLVSKLGLERWNGLVLYKTEGKPPRYCRATTPLDMSSNPQRERLKDGSVLWVRVAPSLVQQGRDILFQKSLEEWRNRNGVKGVADDGSDVKRFIEELGSRLSKTDANELNAQEKEERDTIEGDENRQFSNLTGVYQTGASLRLLEATEQQQRQLLDKACAVAVERHKRSMMLSIQQMEAYSLGALEEHDRHVIFEEQKDSFENLLHQAQELRLACTRGKSIPAPNSDPVTQKSSEETPQTSSMKHVNTKCSDAAEMQSIIRAELQRLLEPLEQVYREGFAALQKEREATVTEGEIFFAHLRQYISTVLRVLHREAWIPGSPPLSAESASNGDAEMNFALEQQQGLLTELLHKYRDLETETSTDLHTTGLRTILSVLNLTQLNMCHYLQSLLEQSSVLQSSRRVAKVTMREVQRTICGAYEKDTVQNNSVTEDHSSSASHFGVSVSMTVGNRYCAYGPVKRCSSLHTDSYNILVAFMLQCTKLSKEEPHLSAKDVEVFLDELLLECGSAQAVADELCLAYHVVSHPMREQFIHETEAHAPHLCALVDLMLHIYAGREVELLLWIRPELSRYGSFNSCEDCTGGCVYYYHTAVDMSQWLLPAALAAK